MESVSQFRSYLEQAGVPFEIIEHQRDVRARATAMHTHTPAEEFAKAVFICVDESPAIAVVPASREVSLSKVRRNLGARSVRKAWEAEIEELCPECEVGAAPPFGPLFDLPVYVSLSIARDEEITFNGGDHQHAIRMRFDDFDRLVEPRVMRLCHHDD